MSTKRNSSEHSSPKRTPLEEAMDPATDPERLRVLYTEGSIKTKRAVVRNPSVPEDLWRVRLLNGWPEAWSNPMTSFYLMAWTHRPEDRGETPVSEARYAVSSVWEDSSICSDEGKRLLADYFQTWWNECTNGDFMLKRLMIRAKIKGYKSSEYKDYIRLLVRCAQENRHLTPFNRSAIQDLEAWAQDKVSLSIETMNTKSEQIHKIIFEYKDQAKLADLIRQEMPEAPTLE